MHRLCAGRYIYTTWVCARCLFVMCSVRTVSKQAHSQQVLATFLRVFSTFDWDTQCITLQGPVPIGILAPDAAPPPDAESRSSPTGPRPGAPSLEPILLEGLRLQFSQEALGIAPPGRHFQVGALWYTALLSPLSPVSQTVSQC